MTKGKTHYQKYSKAWNEKQGIEYRMWCSARYRARKKQLQFDITVKDIAIPKKCPVLAIDIVSGKKQSYNSPTLHRIDSSKGYTKDNVVCISWRANQLIKDATISELCSILAFQYKHMFDIQRLNIIENHPESHPGSLISGQP